MMTARMYYDKTRSATYNTRWVNMRLCVEVREQDGDSMLGIWEIIPR